VSVGRGIALGVVTADGVGLGVGVAVAVPGVRVAAAAIRVSGSPPWPAATAAIRQTAASAVARTRREGTWRGLRQTGVPAA
jgi:hypothetical protein